MKSRNIEKKIEDASAFSHLLKEIEKEKKRAKIAYITGGSLLILASIAFLMFGPFRIPVLSQMGDKILNRESTVETETIEEENNADTTSPDIPSVPTTTTDPDPASTPDSTSTPTTSTKTTAPTKTTTPAPIAEQKTYLCTDGKVALLQSTITQKNYEKDGEMQQMRNLLSLFYYPAYYECVDRSEGCSNEDVDQILYEFNNSTVVKQCQERITLLSTEISKNQGELDYCLTDR